MIPARLVLATANSGKAVELGELAREWGVAELHTLAEYPAVRLPPEDGATYAENAAAKALAVAAATGLPALGDDSGLEVDALGGAPGIRSARYGGAGASDTNRVTRLLAALAHVASHARGARFRCAVALAWPDGRLVEAEAEVTGRIAEAPSGAGGFGYDPVFVPAELTGTYAEASPEEKRRTSHRARAMRALGVLLARA